MFVKLDKDVFINFDYIVRLGVAEVPEEEVPQKGFKFGLVAKMIDNSDLVLLFGNDRQQLTDRMNRFTKEANDK